MLIPNFNNADKLHGDLNVKIRKSSGLFKACEPALLQNVWWPVVTRHQQQFFSVLLIQIMG